MNKCWIVLLSVLLVAGLTAQTVIPGGEVQGSWDSAGSPYQIMGDISIPNNGLLTIGPGVDVVFAGSYKLSVAGQLLCNGDVGSPISFTAVDTLIGWQSIRFSNTAANAPSGFNYTGFSYGKAVNGTGPNDPLNCGGAVWATNAGTITFNHCQFTRCKSASDGSAVYASGLTNLVLNDCLIKDCEAEWFGGVCVYNGSLQMTDCSFFNNVSNVFGAGLYLYECPAVNLVSCQFSNNAAGAVAGIYSLYSPLTIINSLFNDNHTDTGRGGAIGVTGGTATITNCTFAGNFATLDGGAIWFNVMDTPATLTNSLFWDNTPDAIINIGTSYTLSYCSTQVSQGGATNIWGNPQFSDPEDNDYTLQPGSPCVDAGTPDVSGLNLPLWDLNGSDRIIDGDGDTIARIDIGCYERPAPAMTGDIVGQVTDNLGPLPGATISAGSASTTTDAFGLYTLSVEQGTYSVSCTKPGYAPLTQDNVEVTAGQMTIVNFVMTAVSSSDPANTPLTPALVNHPNPFQHDTQISIALPKSSAVQVDIFNTRGQLVRTLLSAELPAGFHEIQWDGCDRQGRALGKGLYFARLVLKDSIVTKKVLKL